MNHMFTQAWKTPAERLADELRSIERHREEALESAVRLEGEAKAERDAAENYQKMAEGLRAAIEILQAAE